MPYNWGPHYIVPSEVIKSYSGAILLREELNEDMLNIELEELGLMHVFVRTNGEEKAIARENVVEVTVEN